MNMFAMFHSDFSTKYGDIANAVNGLAVNVEDMNLCTCYSIISGSIKTAKRKKRVIEHVQRWHAARHYDASRRLMTDHTSVERPPHYSKSSAERHVVTPVVKCVDRDYLCRVMWPGR